MKERGILFQGDMVRAILAGAKTQTRRPFYVETSNVKSAVEHSVYRPDYGSGEWPNVAPGKAWTISDWRHAKVGDRLWVRETWMADPPITDEWPSTQFHGCRPRDHSLIPEKYRTPAHCLYRADGHPDLAGWTPAIHMFRWASRITLKVIDLSIERLQYLTEEDAVAEGVGYVSPSFNCPFARGAYGELWDRINGAGSWAADPWVWAVTFRRIP